MRQATIIISTYTEKKLNDVLQCIRSIEKQTVHPTEIVVVVDPNEELVNFYRAHLPPSVTVAVSPHSGLSHARNTGVNQSNGEIVTFIDDDAVADSQWLENSLANFYDDQVIGVGGVVFADWQASRPVWFPEELDWIVGCSYRGQPLMRTQIRNPIGCNMSFRRSVFEKAGYFRTDVGRRGKLLLCDEETEFSIRAQKAFPEAKILYEPSAVVYHKVNKNRQSIRYVWARSFYEGISKATISFRSKSSASLATEGSYLRFLQTQAIPSRLKRIYKPKNVAQLFTLALSVCGVFAGYIVGSLLRRV